MIPLLFISAFAQEERTTRYIAEDDTFVVPREIQDVILAKAASVEPLKKDLEEASAIIRTLTGELEEAKNAIEMDSKSLLEVQIELEAAKRATARAKRQRNIAYAIIGTTAAGAATGIIIAGR